MGLELKIGFEELLESLEKTNEAYNSNNSICKDLSRIGAGQRPEILKLKLKPGEKRRAIIPVTIGIPFNPVTGQQEGYNREKKFVGELTYEPTVYFMRARARASEEYAAICKKWYGSTLDIENTSMPGSPDFLSNDELHMFAPFKSFITPFKKVVPWKKPGSKYFIDFATSYVPSFGETEEVHDELSFAAQIDGFITSAHIEVKKQEETKDGKILDKQTEDDIVAMCKEASLFKKAKDKGIVFLYAFEIDRKKHYDFEKLTIASTDDEIQALEKESMLSETMVTDKLCWIKYNEEKLAGLLESLQSANIGSCNDFIEVNISVGDVKVPEGASNYALEVFEQTSYAANLANPADPKGSLFTSTENAQGLMFNITKSFDFDNKCIKTGAFKKVEAGEPMRVLASALPSRLEGLSEDVQNKIRESFEAAYNTVLGLNSDEGEGQKLIDTKEALDSLKDLEKDIEMVEESGEEGLEDKIDMTDETDQDGNVVNV